ncbi:MAG: Maf family protein [Actinobacteria bacterium]|nr:Maf family protein [Actinomycetota bacterium]
MNIRLPLQIVLASQSPRRVDLLTQLLDHEFGEGVVTFAIDPPNINETALTGETPIAHVQRLAVAKSHAVAARYNNAIVIIAADTTVDLDGKIFGQPADEQDARTMLNELSGRTHQVHTAVAVVHLAQDGTMLSQAHGVDSAGVSMLEITPEKMEWYLATGESLGKAGSYAVQGDGGALVERVEGSLTTVIGLPLDLLSDLLVQVDCGWKNED